MPPYDTIFKVDNNVIQMCSVLLIHGKSKTTNQSLTNFSNSLCYLIDYFLFFSLILKDLSDQDWDTAGVI